MSHKPFMKGILTTGAALLLALPSVAKTWTQVIIQMS